MNWHKKSLLWFKTAFYTSIGCPIFNPEVIANLFKASSFTTNRNYDVGAFVSILFGSRSPSAILRRIVSAVFNSLNGVLIGRDWPHVCKEVFKPKPSLANLNSATTIVFEFFAVRISATIQHALPTRISLCFVIVTLPVGFHAGTCDLNPEASARVYRFSPQVLGINNLFIPAIAFAKVDCPPFSPWQFSDNQKSSNLLANEADFLRHSNVYALLCSAVGRWFAPTLGCVYNPKALGGATRIGGMYALP